MVLKKQFHMPGSLLLLAFWVTFSFGNDRVALSSADNEWNFTYYSPGGQTVAQAGENLEIVWLTTTAVTSISLELYRRGFFLIKSPQALYKNAGTYLWPLPDNIETDSEYTVKAIDGTDPSRFSFSEKFTIYNKPMINLQLQSVKPVGDSVSFSWDGKGALDTINFSYSLDTGKTWARFYSSMSNAGKSSWNVPSYNGITTVLLRSMSTNRVHSADTVSIVIGKAVQLETPSGTITSDYRIQFKWKKMLNVTSYTLFIDTNASFNTPLNVIPLTDTFFIPAADLFPGIYHWKVQPMNFSIYTSKVATFTIQDKRIPLAISFSPKFTSSRRPRFSWHSVSGAAGYTITIADNNLFSPAMTILPVGDTTFTPTENLPLGEIYWRVKSDLLNTWSLIQTLTIQSEEIPLLLRFDSAAVAISKPTFTWRKVPGVSTYTFELFNAVSERIVSASVTDTFYTQAIALRTGTYHWRVQSSEPITSAFSQWDYFTVLPPTGSLKKTTSPETLFRCFVKEKTLHIAFLPPKMTVYSLSLITLNGKLITQISSQGQSGTFTTNRSIRLSQGVYMLRGMIDNYPVSTQITIVQ